MDFILLLVVGAVLASAFQGARRGKVTAAERAANPTVLESFSAGLSKLSDEMEKIREDLWFRSRHCAWFEAFEQTVTLFLEIAEKQVAHEAELDRREAQSPGFRAIYEKNYKELKAELDTSEQPFKCNAPVQPKVADRLDPVWLASGRPKPPVPTADRDRSERQARVFVEQEKQHDAFVARIRARLDDKALRAVFDKITVEEGYGELVRIHFSAESVLSRAERAFGAASDEMFRARVISAARSHIRAKAYPNRTNEDEAKQVSNFQSEPISVARSRLGQKKTNLALDSEFWEKLTAPPVSLGSTGTIPGDKIVEKCARWNAQFDTAPVVSREKARTAELRRIATDRAIPYLVHFTQCDNLPSILQHGLRSVEECSARGIPARRNDEQRLDGAMDGISLSVSFPNYRMFYKYRQLDPATDWAVLILSPQILWTKPCCFFRMNAADHRMRHRPRNEAATPEAFQEMFLAEGTTRPDWLPPYDPTDPQAEVMVHDVIGPELIDRVVFASRPSHDRWAPSIKGIQTTVSAPGRGMFSTRQYARAKA